MSELTDRYMNDAADSYIEKMANTSVPIRLSDYFKAGWKARESMSERPSRDQTEILNECLEALEISKIVLMGRHRKPEFLRSVTSCISKLKNLLGQPETKNDTE